MGKRNKVGEGGWPDVQAGGLSLAGGPGGVKEVGSSTEMQGNCKVAGTLRRAVRRTAGNPDFPPAALGECLLLFLPQEDFAVLLHGNANDWNLQPHSEIIGSLVGNAAFLRADP